MRLFSLQRERNVGRLRDLSMALTSRLRYPVSPMQFRDVYRRRMFALRTRSSVAVTIYFPPVPIPYEHSGRLSFTDDDLLNSAARR